jgi:outer membrane protein TolC
MITNKKYIICSLFIVGGSIYTSAQVKSLDDYLNTAIANSPVLKDYRIQLQQNSLDSMMAGTAYKPQVNFDGVALYAPAFGPYGYDQTISNGGEVSAIVSATQQITPRKQIALTRMLSATEGQGISDEAQMELNDLRKEVTNDYLNTCLLQQRVTFYMQSDSFLTKEVETVKDLAGKGSYKISDYYELLVEEQSERSQIKDLLQDLTRSFSELNVASGITDTIENKLVVPSIEPFKQNDIRQLAAYKKFQADSIKFMQQNEIVDAGYKPKLSWYADAGYESTPYDISYFPHYPRLGNSLGLFLSIPIYDGNKRNLQHQSLQLSEDTRANYEHFFMVNYTTRVNSLAKQIEGERKLVLQLQDELQQAEKWMRIDEDELGVGNISVTDFLMSVKKVLDVKNDLSEARITQQLLQNEFNYWNH